MYITQFTRTCKPQWFGVTVAGRCLLLLLVVDKTNQHVHPMKIRLHLRTMNWISRRKVTRGGHPHLSPSTTATVSVKILVRYGEERPGRT